LNQSYNKWFNEFATESQSSGMDNKLEFAKRLREAMQAAGLEPRPGVLLNLFNTHYWGRSVSFQAVSRWLRGEAIPEQDKLLVLAGVLNVQPEVLRFGDGVRQSIEQRKRRWEEGASYLERETFDAFLQLPAAQRKLLREVILTFAKANSSDKK
jgi:transcriptional regulator with XRE-family HTH domain